MAIRLTLLNQWSHKPKQHATNVRKRVVCVCGSVVWCGMCVCSVWHVEYMCVHVSMHMLAGMHVC